MEYTQEQIDAMKKLMEAYNAIKECQDSLGSWNLISSELARIHEAIKTLSEPMKDSLDGISV